MLAEVRLALARYWEGWNLQSCETSQLIPPPFPFPPVLSFSFPLRGLIPALPKVQSQRSTPMPKVDPWIFPNHWSSCWICWISSSSSCKSTVHNHMFSLSSLPTYIASIGRSGCSPYQHAPASDPSSTLTKKLRICAVPFVFSCQAPCQVSFGPLLPLGLKFVSVSLLLVLALHESS